MRPQVPFRTASRHAVSPEARRRIRRSLLTGLSLIIPLAFEAASARGNDDHRERRLSMVRRYIQAEGITNERVLEVMRRVPRHEFVPKKLVGQAYNDAALPIGFRQTISPPFIVAYMTETIDPKPVDRVLEIGTGSGYQAAVLSGLVDEVYTIEIVRQLGRAAARRLARLGYDNVHAKVGDGYKGWPEHAPFDRIIVTCSPESVPQPLIEQLREGGRMIIPLGERYQQVFHLMEKRNGRLVQTKLVPTLFVPMTGLSESNRKTKPDPRNPRLVNGSFEHDENNDQLADGWHYQRKTSLATDGAVDGRQYVCFENEEPGQTSQMLQGVAIDGRHVQRLQVRLWVRHENLVPGDLPSEVPAAVVHFFDVTRRNFHTSVIGRWRGSIGWQRVKTTIDVPSNSRELIVRVGLNGGTGRLCVDGLECMPSRQ